jgi:hypothetical protein
MLQNAVHPLAELHQVKLTTDQNKVAGVALLFEDYFKLIYLAVVNYDESFVYKKMTWQSMLVHDVMEADDLDPTMTLTLASTWGWLMMWHVHHQVHASQLCSGLSFHRK